MKKNYFFIFLSLIFIFFTTNSYSKWGKGELKFDEATMDHFLSSFMEEEVKQ